jgi:prepilin-type N-terminal cleavage/methylation domain-containing protein
VLIMRNRRGFTLIELLISLVVLGIVTASLFKLVTTSQRVSRAQTERVTLQSNIRAGAIVLPSELRQINAISGGGTTRNDIITTPAAGATTLQFRAMRGLGFVCTAPIAAGTELRIYGPPTAAWAAPKFSGLRAPQAIRDSAFVFLEGANADISSDDSWLGVRISNVATGVCADGSTGYVLTISPAAPTLVGASIRGPVRTFEDMEYGLYSSGGEWWLGARSVSMSEASMQPVLGPLTSDGVSFNFLDGTGAATTDRSLVKSIQVTLKGLTDQPIVVGSNTKTAYVRDSLVTQVVLRNALR